jgi:GT2 family glycosyltransferase
MSAAQPLFPILVKVWAGQARHDFAYIRRSLPSLLNSNLPAEARVIIVDDCSTDVRLRPYLEALVARYPQAKLWTNPHNLGPNHGHYYNFPRVVERFPDARWYVLCDDDVIYHPGWLQRLIQVHAEAGAAGLRGIFTAINFRFRPHHQEVQLPTSIVLVKEQQACFNWFIPREVYEQVGPFQDAGIAYDTEYCRRLTEQGLPVICLKPSYVQNIGYHGAYQSDESHTADDYVGRVGTYLYLRRRWYQFRTLIRDTAERIPEGRAKNAIKFCAYPLRKLIGV